MKEAVLSIKIEKTGDGEYCDSVVCSGSQVEVFGMIHKIRVTLDDIQSVVESDMKKGERYE